MKWPNRILSTVIPGYQLVSEDAKILKCSIYICKIIFDLTNVHAAMYFKWPGEE